MGWSSASVTPRMAAPSTSVSRARGRAFRAVAEDVLGELDDVLVRVTGPRNRDALVRALKGVIEL